jgi:uncharacterized protein
MEKGMRNMKESKFNIKIGGISNDRYVIYNTLKDSITLIDSDVMILLEKKEIEKIPPELLSELRSGGIIVDDQLDELKYYAYLYNKARYNSDVYMFTVITTYVCNLRCTYCYEGGGLFNKTMSWKEAEKCSKFIEKSIDKKAHKGVSLLLYGGEPLIGKDACLKIIKKVNNHCKDIGLDFYGGIATNGTLITEDVIENLFKPYNFRAVQITLDGNRKDHNSRRKYKNGAPTYDIILSKIKMLDNALVHGHIRVNIDKQNVKGLNELFEDLTALNLKNSSIYVSPTYSMTPACKSLEHLCFTNSELHPLEKKIYPQMKRTGIGTIIRPIQRFNCMFETDDSFVIDPYLNLYKCLVLTGDEKYRVGSIDNDGNAHLSSTFYDILSRDPLNHEECRRCPYLPLCSGGCAAAAVDKKGSYHGIACAEEKYSSKNRMLQYVKEKFKDEIHS